MVFNNDRVFFCLADHGFLPKIFDLLILSDRHVLGLNQIFIEILDGVVSQSRQVGWFKSLTAQVFPLLYVFNGVLVTYDDLGLFHHIRQLCCILFACVPFLYRRIGADFASQILVNKVLVHFAPVDMFYGGVGILWDVISLALKESKVLGWWSMIYFILGQVRIQIFTSALRKRLV